MSAPRWASVVAAVGSALCAGPAAAETQAAPSFDRLYFRAGLLHLAPLSSSDEMELVGVEGPASLAIEDGPVAGSGSSVSSATIPAVILGYRLTPRFSLETILGTPFTVRFQATGTLASESLAPTALGIPTGVPALGPELGEAKALPPVVTAVYSFSPERRVRPYAGLGVSVLFAYDAKITNPALTEVSEPTFEIPPAPGLVLQTGLEATLYRRIYARLDVKFIAFMRANAEVRDLQMRTPELPLFDHVDVGTARMSVWVNPLVVLAGVGTDF